MTSATARLRRLLLLVVAGGGGLGAWGEVGAQEVPEELAPPAGESGEPVEDLGELPTPGEGLEAAVSGAAYRLGPGDVLSINIWGPQPISHRLAVTLEGKLLIPYVGELDVHNLLLDDAKRVIREELLRHYRNVDLSITLVTLRRFQIHVLGQVRVPGSYMATAVSRVSTAIALARGFLDNASQRRILIENGDSIRAEADLYAFLRRGIGEHNPWLSDGDRIYVPFSKDFIQVVGEVSAPGRVQFLEGDRLSDAILLSVGFTAAAFLDTLEVARYQPGAADPIRFFVPEGGGLLPANPQEAAHLPEMLEPFRLPAPAVPDGRAPSYVDFLLKPNDVVFVRREPEIRLRRFVEIQGEIVYPGNYPIEEGRTRLSDLVAWAGGITDHASLIEAKLVRRGDINLEDPEFERLKKIPVADMKEDEYEYFKVKSRQVSGQMVVDFEKALGGDAKADPRLERGDLVVIPARKDFVSMLGFVSRPGNLAYRQGLTAKDYIKQSGGYADDADKGDTRVIRARGGEWMSPGDAGKLEPGDVVFVPEKEDRDWWKIFRETLTVAAQLATIYLVIDNATN